MNHTKDRDIEETKPFYLVYFDILGYRDYLKDSENDERKLLSSIKTEYEKIRNFTKKQQEKISGFKTKTFSDNVVLAIESAAGRNEISVFNSLVQLTGLFQLIFLEKHNLLTRGAIVYGNVFIDEAMIFGPGLVAAVEAEEQKAIFPRIIIDESIKEQLGESILRSEHIRKDEDGAYYLDCFSWMEFYIRKKDSEECFKRIQGNLRQRVKKYCKFPPIVKEASKIHAREKVISKHLWMLEKFNNYCSSNESMKYVVKYRPSLNQRLMLFDISLEKD